MFEHVGYGYYYEFNNELNYYYNPVGDDDLPEIKIEKQIKLKTHKCIKITH